MVFIYVLQLKENKWYIGKTETSKFRIDTHFDSAGSEFTKKYPPQEIYQIIPECDKYDEDKYVKKYMDKYGIDNVRGGTYCRLELTSNEKEVIQKELWGANDLCFLCGGDHFVKDCPNNKQVEELVEEQPDERLKWIEYYEDTLSNIDDNSRNYHSIKDCEFKLFMLQNEKKEEPELKLSKTLTNKINTNKRLFEENFNKILYKIDEIMNNIPELVIAYNMGWGNKNISSLDYPKPAEEYKPHKLIGFEIKIDMYNSNKSIDIIICYEHLQSLGNGSFNKHQLYTKNKNNLDIKLKPNDSQLICSKLNELGFETKFTGNYSGINLNTIQNQSFAIILEE
jgi:hypothetical protein